MSDKTYMRRLAAEALGTALLLATVVGSGIMAEALAGGNIAIALLCNTLPTGAILFVLIIGFGSISGAHFNPAVTLAELLIRRIGGLEASGYVAAQVLGGVAGVWLAHLMFDLEVLQISARVRTGFGQFLSEGVAAFGLVLVIFLSRRRGLETVAASVGLYITAAYWFTASTSFANPAVTIARGFSDSFAGIRPDDILPFIGAQIAGAILAVGVARFIAGDDTEADVPG